MKTIKPNNIKEGYYEIIINGFKTVADVIQRPKSLIWSGENKFPDLWVVPARWIGNDSINIFKLHEVKFLKRLT